MKLWFGSLDAEPSEYTKKVDLTLIQGVGKELVPKYLVLIPIWP